MKLEKYTKISGGLRTPTYREVPEEFSSRRGKKEEAVKNIIVEVQLFDKTIHKFQGDESSQDRLHRAYTILTNKNIQDISWKTVDNKLVKLVPEDILNIMLASSEAQTALWV